MSQLEVEVMVTASKGAGPTGPVPLRALPLHPPSVLDHDDDGSIAILEHGAQHQSLLTYIIDDDNIGSDMLSTCSQFACHLSASLN